MDLLPYDSEAQWYGNGSFPQAGTVSWANDDSMSSPQDLVLANETRCKTFSEQCVGEPGWLSTGFIDTYQHCSPTSRPREDSDHPNFVQNVSHDIDAGTSCTLRLIKATKPQQNKKPRLACTTSGCKQTFPRAYELRRHQDSIHNPTFNLCCSVWGCNRIGRPFTRADKFREHYRKHHRNPEKWLCIFEQCRMGPLTLPELVDHLNLKHGQKGLTEPNLSEAVKVLSLRCLPLGHAATKGGSAFLFQYTNACPLAFFGCDFQRLDPNDLNEFRNHITEHSLLQRSKGYPAIRSVIGLWPTFRIADCPICQKRVCEKGDFIPNQFIRHVGYSHSTAERVGHAVELGELLHPLFTEEFKGYSNRRAFDRIKEDIFPILNLQ